MERFLPGRHLIDSFGNGGFRLGAVSHQGSLVIVPSGVRALPSNTITAEALALIIAEKADIDMFLIGTGRDITALTKPVSQRLRDENISFDLMSTNAAVRTYNVVVEEDRRVAAILMAV
jgi:uncharacterized protein